MHRTGKAPLRWRSALLSAALCALAGLALQFFPVLGGWLAHGSYDLAVLFRPASVPPEVVVVYMDEKSFRELEQKPGNWDRELHADLLNWLTREQARLVVLDVTLTDPGSPASNAKLVRALQANGSVAVAAWFAREENPNISIRTVERPLPEFEGAARRWGLSEVESDGATIVRRHYQGIDRFMPVSRSHPGLVQILHVGRNDAAGHFYYVMELADSVSGFGFRVSSSTPGLSAVDQLETRNSKPETYLPRTFGSDLEHRGALPPAECARLGAALAGALDHLHQRQLIHRDIKPANIIFVEDAPKLADIGLVTSISGTRHDSVSQVGTEGYVAPEGPGTAAADVYSLGKVLYEACMGQDRRKFPELPTAVYDGADYAERMALNEIIVKACATKVEERYRTAGELREALVKLAEAGGVKRKT